MAITSETRANKVFIQINERLDRWSAQAFKKAFQGTYSSGHTYVVDMSQVPMVDSAGLELLLKLREYAGNDKADITLRNCSDTVCKILYVAHFQNFFRIL